MDWELFQLSWRYIFDSPCPNPFDIPLMLKWMKTRRRRMQTCLSAGASARRNDPAGGDLGERFFFRKPASRTSSSTSVLGKEQEQFSSGRPSRGHFSMLHSYCPIFTCSDARQYGVGLNSSLILEVVGYGGTNEPTIYEQYLHPPSLSLIVDSLVLGWEISSYLLEV